MRCTNPPSGDLPWSVELHNPNGVVIEDFTVEVTGRKLDHRTGLVVEGITAHHNTG